MYCRVGGAVMVWEARLAGLSVQPRGIDSLIAKRERRLPEKQAVRSLQGLPG